MITEFNPNTFILKDIFKLYKQDINKIDQFLNDKIPGNYIRFTTKKGRKMEKRIDKIWITYKYQVMFIKNNNVYHFRHPGVFLVFQRTKINKNLIQ
jgi:hypothetical protein